MYFIQKSEIKEYSTFTANIPQKNQFLLNSENKINAIDDEHDFDFRSHFLRNDTAIAVSFNKILNNIAENDIRGK